MANTLDDSFDLEGEDVYAAAQGSLKKTSGTDTDDEDEEEDHPSVEEELAKRESGDFEGLNESAGASPKKKAEPIALTEEEEEMKSDLDYIKEAAKEVEAERDELFNSDEEE